MLKKTFRVKDLDNNEVEEIWYFNLSVAEMAKMHLTADGDVVTHLTSIMKSGNGSKIIAAFEDLVRRSVGKRSDSQKFIKSEAIADEFMGSDAYAQFFMELVTNGNAGADFVNGIMPADLAKQAAAIQAKQQPQGVTPTFSIADEVQLPDAPFENRQAMTPDQFSWEEMMEMTEADLRRLGEGEMYEKPGLTKKTLEDYTRDELMRMDNENFMRLVGSDAKKWPKPVMVIAMQRRANARKK